MFASLLDLIFESNHNVAFLSTKGEGILSDDEQSTVSSEDRQVGETPPTKTSVFFGISENHRKKSEVDDWRERVLSISLQVQVRLAELQIHFERRSSLQIEQETLENQLKLQADSVIQLWKEISGLQHVIHINFSFAFTKVNETF